MKRLFPILLGLLAIGASVQFGQQVNPEVKAYPLQIICPLDGFVFYDCPVQEIFADEHISNLGCKPRKGFPEITNAGENQYIFCPIDRDSPIRSNGNYTISIFTNKGWMPKRRRY